MHTLATFLGEEQLSVEWDGAGWEIDLADDPDLAGLLERLSEVEPDGEADLRILGEAEDWGAGRVEVRELGQSLQLRFRDEGLGSRGAGLVDCIQQIASQWAERPESRASELVLGSGTGLRGEEKPRPDLGLHEVFSQVAARQPGAIALREGEAQWSYAELDGKSDQLARELTAAGVRPGSVVAIRMARGSGFCVSVLGILKSGAAYLPVDPDYPQERQDGMLEDGGCELVLVGDRSQVPSPALREICVDVEALGAVIDESVRVSRGGGHAAYLIFTSGSTGRPKGVVNTHAGALNEVLSCVELWGLGGGDRVSQFASVSFDVSVEEIWATWLAGAGLVVTPPDAMSSYARFMGWVAEQEISVLDLPTAFWNSIVNAVAKGDAEVPECLRLVVVGGEFARTSSYETWKRLVGDQVRWVNAYGPTEAAIACTFFCDWRDGEFSGDVPIGRPVANSVAYVVDRHGRSLPAGFVGELWVGGVCLAKGYKGLPEMTAERFIDDPFSGASGDRVYKTGDLVWVDRHGRLRYVGRRDRQVKVRGVRIELDEVEDALSRVGEIEDAAVSVLEDPDGGVELVAYLAPEVEVEAIIGQLRGMLPAAMLPSRFVGLAELPKTNSGKIDYNRLPELDPVVVEAGDGARVDPLVETVIEAMREVNLAVRHGGENFFSIGGHSLRMMELIAALSRRGLQVTPDEFLVDPTAKGLAEGIRGRRQCQLDDGQWSPLKPLRKVAGAPVLILPHSTPGDVMGYGNLVNHLGAGISCYGLVARGTVAQFEPHVEMREMAGFYADAIVADLDGPYHLCGWCFGGMLALEIAQQLRARGEEVGRLILIDTELPPMPGLGRFRALGKLRALAKFPLPELVRYVLDKLPTGGSGSDAAGDPHVRDSEVYRTNEAAYDAYVGECYPGHIDEITSGINLWDGLPVLFSDDKRSRAAESVEGFVVGNGHHMSLMRDPVVEQVAARIRQLLLD